LVNHMQLLLPVLVLVCVITSCATEALSPQQEGIVGFNVRGQVFQTTKQTILRYARPGAYLVRLMYGETTAPRDAQGNFFIDRDPQSFALILDFMQYGFWTSSNIAPQRVREDLEFYGIVALEINCYTSISWAQKVSCKKRLAIREELLPLTRALVANTTAAMWKVAELRDGWNALWITTTEAQFNATILAAKTTPDTKRNVEEFEAAFVKLPRLFVPSVSVFLTDSLARKVFLYELESSYALRLLVSFISPEAGSDWLKPRRDYCKEQTSCIPIFTVYG